MAAKPKHDKPHGMEPYDKGSPPDDLGALSDQQQERLNKFKVRTRMENEKYMRQHPEVQVMLTSFIGEVLTQRPDNIRDFSAAYFTQPSLPDKVERSLEARRDAMKQNVVLSKTVNSPSSAATPASQPSSA